MALFALIFRDCPHTLPSQSHCDIKSTANTFAQERSIRFQIQTFASERLAVDFCVTMMVRR